MFELVLAVGVVIVTSALCSLFEATLYAVPASHVEKLVQRKRRAGVILKALRKKVDQPITAILALNTVANTAGAAVAGALAVRALGEQWLGWFSAAFTLAILLFSEVIPKTAGVVYSRGLASFVAYPMQVLVWIFRPVIWLCSAITNVITGEREESVVSSEDLTIMVRMGQRTGTIGEDEATVMENILALRAKKVKEILTPRTVLVSLDGSLKASEARKDERIFNHSRLPVYTASRDEVTGIVMRKDLLAAASDAVGGGDVTLDELARPAHFLLEDTPLDRALGIFLERREHMCVVIDDFGGLVGVVTLEDVLEEILGKEIVDETDEADDLRAVARKRRDALLAANRPSGDSEEAPAEPPKA